MIHSLSGGKLNGINSYTYVFVKFSDASGGEIKRWFISPFALVKAGDKVVIPVRCGTATGEVLRVEKVTDQTAPFPVKRTEEIISVIPD